MPEIDSDFLSMIPATSVTRRKLPNVYKSFPKMISLEKWNILTPLQNLPKNVGDLGQLVVAKGFKKLPKVQKSPNLVTLSSLQKSANAV